MLRRTQTENIPTDLLRTVSLIADQGSFGKAGERLGLSQPAISAQIKRIQKLVGGSIFMRTPGGVALNDRGRQLMPYIRRLLDLNDQILQLGGARPNTKPVRIGLSDLYCQRFLDMTQLQLSQGAFIMCNSSKEILRGIADGYVDICLVLKPSPEMGRIVHTWKERLVWVRSRSFVVSPGAPVPMVGWPGLVTDQIAVELFEAKGIAHRMAFTSPGQDCRLAAVRAGLGIFILPDWAVPEPLMPAKDYYLPSIPLIDAGIIVRNEIDMEEIHPVLSSLTALAETSVPRDGSPQAA